MINCVRAACRAAVHSHCKRKQAGSGLLCDSLRCLPFAVFLAEDSGETLTAQTVANETGAALYALTMGMGEGEMGCTDAIYKNIDTIREALS